jgi:serine/threonine protein kinase
MQAGDTLGRYEIEELLARGGMAEVWLAISRGVGGFAKKVVLKTILPDLAENPDFVRMFINEALLAARLNHPNIVQIFDLGQIDDRYFIAMEYVPGRTLRQISRRCRQKGQLIPPWFVLRALATVCDGLQYAHDQRDDQGNPLGLVHRDITPENIMISFTGTVKILDFGVAKATAAASLTRAGTLKGKYAYISPEQVHGAPADRRSDVYSVGVMLYELLTGSRPFRGSNDLDLLRKVAAGNPAPSRELAPWIPVELDATIMQSLAAKPESRFQNATAFGEKLLSFLKQAQDHRGQREMGLFVSGIYPDDPNIPSDILKSLTQAKQESQSGGVLSKSAVMAASYSGVSHVSSSPGGSPPGSSSAAGSVSSSQKSNLDVAFVPPPEQTVESNAYDSFEIVEEEDTSATTRGGDQSDAGLENLAHLDGEDSRTVPVDKTMRRQGDQQQRKAVVVPADDEPQKTPASFDNKRQPVEIDTAEQEVSRTIESQAQSTLAVDTKPDAPKEAVKGPPPTTPPANKADRAKPTGTEERKGLSSRPTAASKPNTKAATAKAVTAKAATAKPATAKPATAKPATAKPAAKAPTKAPAQPAKPTKPAKAAVPVATKSPAAAKQATAESAAAKPIAKPAADAKQAAAKPATDAKQAAAKPATALATKPETKPAVAIAKAPPIKAKPAANEAKEKVAAKPAAAPKPKLPSLGKPSDEADKPAKTADVKDPQRRPLDVKVSLPKSASVQKDEPKAAKDAALPSSVPLDPKTSDKVERDEPSSPFDQVARADSEASKSFLEQAPPSPPEEDRMSALWTAASRPRSEADRMSALWTPAKQTTNSDPFSSGEKSDVWSTGDSRIDEDISSRSRDIFSASGSTSSRDVFGISGSETKEQTALAPSDSAGGFDFFSSRPRVDRRKEDDVFTSFSHVSQSSRTSSAWGSDDDKESAPALKARSSGADWGIFVEKKSAVEEPPKEEISEEGRQRREAAELFDEGLVSMRKGDLDDAHRCWQQAIELAPENRTYQSNLKMLKKRMESDL